MAFDFELSIRRMGMHVRRWLCLLFGAAKAPREQAVERRRRAGIRERIKRNSGGSLLAGGSFYQEAYVMFRKAYKSSGKGIRSRVRWIHMASGDEGIFLACKLMAMVLTHAVVLRSNMP